MKVKTFVVENHAVPIEKIEIGTAQSNARIFYNYFSKIGKSQIDVSKEEYVKNNDAKIFYFAANKVETSLTVQEVEELISSLQSMVDSVKS